MSGAVFLSYSSQDAEAARRICDTLRAAGVEVWFDQSELRGGDSWDQKIRRQIRECALFIPVISASTQSRSEGYFRREWKLAVERTHDMADHVAFLVPVVLDGTSDRDAHVPEKFRETQWTRLPGGATPAAFAERIRTLLTSGTTEAAAGPMAAPVVARELPPRRTQPRWPVPVAVCILLAAGLVYWAPWRTVQEKPAAPALASHSVEPAPDAGLSGPDPKSVAVLAFKNLSDDKENEYFSDGISEELLTVLQKIPGLHVAAQTSAFYYKGKDVMAQDIGRQLKVANIVDGSVQKIGNRVRIMARLTRAATGEEIWAVSFPPREVTDVFALQDEIAQSIVGELRGHLGVVSGDASAKAEIEAQVELAEKGGTKNEEAHELYLQGLFFMRQFSTAGFDSAEVRLRHAVQLDPSFALAWAALSRALSLQWSWATVSSPSKIVDCYDAARRSLALEPNLSEGYAALFDVQMSYDLDLVGGAESSRNALRIAPEDAENLADAGSLAIALGNLDEAVALLKRAASLDPLNTEIRIYLAGALSEDGRLEEAFKEARETLSFNPDAGLIRGFIATQLADHGSQLDEALALANAEPSEWSRLTAQSFVLHALKRIPEADAALKSLIDKYANVAAYQVAEIYSVKGDPDEAFTWLERAHRQHDGGLTWAANDPALKAIHGDPRWAALLKKIHLPVLEPN